MKKIISIMLCVFMLLGVTSLGVFAEGEEVDNSVIDLTSNVATAPVLDGVISEGEYTYNHGGELTEDILWTSFDAEGILIGVDTPYTAGYRSAKWALAIDNDYLYVAVEVNKVSGATPQAEFMITRNKVTHPNDSYAFRSYIKADGTTASEANSFFSFGTNGATAVNDGETYVYEGKIARSEIGLSTDTIHFMSRVYSDDGEWGSFLLFGLGAESMAIKVTPLADAADEPAKEYSIMDLEAFGQAHWVIAGKTEDAPIPDGIVEDGEYTLAIKDMVPANDDADDRFFCIDPQGLDVENFNLYLSYDDDYIYIGAEVIEDEILAGENITFRFGLDQYNFEKRINIKFTHGGAPESDNAEAFATELIDGGISYEIVIKRTAMTDYLGYESNDDIKEFALQIVMGDDRDEVNHPELWPEMWFGCAVPGGYEGLASSAEAAESEGKLWGFMGHRMPHVMALGDVSDAPATEPAQTEPAETTPAETTPTETTPTETTPADTTTPDTPDAEGGCGASVAAVAVALVWALGTCTVFVNKRR